MYVKQWKKRFPYGSQGELMFCTSIGHGNQLFPSVDTSKFEYWITLSSSNDEINNPAGQTIQIRMNQDEAEKLISSLSHALKSTNKTLPV